MGWYLYFGIVLVASLLLGWHLGRFRSAYTEMTGMMAGMTIGMLGGFALGYGMTAAAGRDLFLGNLVGVLLGAVLGAWFGRSGELMGMMDGAMGGVMGGSMGAMIAAMIFPDWKLQWTGVLFGGVYVVGALALTALIESRTPEHEHLHWLLPSLSRARRTERVPVASRAATQARASTAAAPKYKAAPVAALSSTKTAATASTTVRESLPAARPITDYYAMLKVEKNSGLEAIEEAYLKLLATADGEAVERADRALVTLRDPQRRSRYDSALEESRKRQPTVTATGMPTSTAPAREGSPASSERGDCCPPPKKKSATAEPAGTAAVAPRTATGPALMARTPTQLPSRSTSTEPARAHQTGQLPSLKSANAALASRSATNEHGNAHKEKHGKQGKHTARQNGRQDVQPADARSNKAYGGEQRESRHARRPRYVEPESGFGKRVMIGAAVGAAATLLVFWIAVAAAGGASGAPITQGSYSNPSGAIYHAPGPVPSEAQLEGQAVVAAVGADGVQSADLVLDEGSSSYNPPAIKVKKGVPVRLNLSSTGGGRDCRSVVDIPAIGARGFIDSSGPSTMDFTPTQAGVYEFNCPMRMVNPSYLVVTN